MNQITKKTETQLSSEQYRDLLGKIEEGYGSTLIKRLSTDLKKEFPQMGL